MKNKKVVLIVLFIIVVLGIGIFILLNKSSNSKNKTDDYKLTYYSTAYKNGLNIEIHNNKVIITNNFACDDIRCDSFKKEIKEFEYSEDNITKLINFIGKNFTVDKEGKIEIWDAEITEYQKNIIESLLLGENFFEIDIEDYKYRLNYLKNDSLSYAIYFKNDETILVKKLTINDAFDITNIETYSLKFSSDSLNILNNYIKGQTEKEGKNNIYKYSNLRKDETPIINSIIENNESYLSNIESIPKLIYTIQYEGIDCDTPILYLYSDNTYEYYDTFTTLDERLIPKTGAYTFDVTKIIDSVNKYEENSQGPYYIEDYDENIFETYGTNIELQEFLNSIDVDLDKCLEYQQ